MSSNLPSYLSATNCATRGSGDFNPVSFINASRDNGPESRITATPLKNADTWLNEYRRHWEANLDSLDAYLTRLQSQEKKP